jgi:hypothetical protein
MGECSNYAMKHEWLDFWGYEYGSPEAEEAWENKVRLDEDAAQYEGQIHPNMGIIADIQPYKSQITGEIIHSRSRHRNHLKDHNCIEVGNEKQEAPKKKEVDWKPEIVKLVHQAKEASRK